MRSTVRLEESLLEQAKREAARRGVTLASLIEMGLRLVLAQSRRHQRRPKAGLPVCRLGGGVLPGVDLADTTSLLDTVDGIQ